MVRINTGITPDKTLHWILVGDETLLPRLQILSFRSVSGPALCVCVCGEEKGCRSVVL